MSAPPPPRRFKPEPVETNAKSSRRFAPEPVETTTKSSRRFAPEPVETTAKTNRLDAVESSTGNSAQGRRRFAPEPVETMTKSTRRFAFQPVETTARSSRSDGSANTASAKRSKFTPMPVETSTRSSRDRSERSRDKNDSGSTTSESSQPPRKFAPQLIETAKRTRKAGDTVPAILPADKTEATPAKSLSPFRESKLRPLRTPPSSMLYNDSESPRGYLEARRLGIPISSRQRSASSSRTHSFRVPDLDPIDSSQSEESSPPSLSSSPPGSLDQSYMYKHATRLRESVDDRSSGYLLQIAARAAEKQLREQALAAFPNNDEHEPVDHFIDRDIDEGRLGSGARQGDSSYVQVDWELRDMQAHQERLSQQRKSKKQAVENVRAQENKSSRSPWGNPAADMFVGLPRDHEIDRMRTGARPPMLGADIQFPRCSSPDLARFDVTQGCEALRDSTCYPTQHGQAREEEHEGLWEQKSKSSQKSMWSAPVSRMPSQGGLWHGFCINTGLTPPMRGHTGLMTPMVETDNPMDMAQSSPNPSTGTSSFLAPPKTDFAGLDEKLQAEVSIEEEFSDEFITQIYNYLSMGYPSIARDYDEELSKISRISVMDLRQDDHLSTTRGYIKLDEDEPGAMGEENCMRWRALRLYVYEWARQQPRMIPGAHALGGFGVGAAARKGSWAI